MMSVVDNYPSRLTTVQKRDWVAAHILHTNNIYAALAGPPTAAFYGSDSLWAQIVLLINDPAFEDACKVLHANGYKDVSMDQGDYEMLQPPDSDPDGKKAMKWRLLSRKKPWGGAIILAPASHWHFKVTDDTTIIVDGMRLPKFIYILQHSYYFLANEFNQLQAMDVWVLRKKYPNSLTELSPADRFFVAHFFSVRRINSRRKVAELWDGLNQGIFTVEEAVALNMKGGTFQLFR